MTVLLEGVSLVFENTTLNTKYPGGLLGFRAAWDNGSFCTDGTIAKISFFETDDAFCTLMTMPDYGLNVSTHFAADVAVFLHGGALWAPCLWLETSREGSEIQGCWHVTEEPGERLVVPKYFRPGAATLARYAHLDEKSIMAVVTHMGEGNGDFLYRDETSNNLFAGPRPLLRH